MTTMPEQKTGSGVGDATPQTLNHFIGNKNAVERVRIALDAMFNGGDGAVFPHCLMLGARGTGKTLLAAIVAAEVGLPDRFTQMLGQAVDSHAMLNGMLLEADGGGILFIDEIHSLCSSAQLSLLKALDERKIYLTNGTDSNSPPHEITLGKFTLLAATTEEYGLLPPLLDRFKLILRFDFYSTDDLAQIVGQRARALGWLVDDGVVAQIAKRGKNIPRLGLRLLESCWRTARAENSDRITAAHLHRTVELEQLDSLGLDSAEQAYLKLLKQNDGTARLNVIASRLGLPTRTVEGLEQFLLRANLIDKSDMGMRVLTPNGRLHLMEMDSPF
jgi:Holliday junction DNA helicase RuvB